MGLLDTIKETIMSSDPRTSRIRQGILQQIGPMAGRRPVAPTFGEIAASVVAGKRQGERDYLQEELMTTDFKVLDDGRIAKINKRTGEVTYTGEAKPDYESPVGKLFADRDILKTQFDKGIIKEDEFNRRSKMIDDRISVLTTASGTDTYNRKRFLNRITEHLMTATDMYGESLYTSEDITEKIKEFDRIGAESGLYGEEDMKLYETENVKTSNGQEEETVEISDEVKEDFEKKHGKKLEPGVIVLNEEDGKHYKWVGPGLDKWEPVTEEEVQKEIIIEKEKEKIKLHPNPRKRK